MVLGEQMSLSERSIRRVSIAILTKCGLIVTAAAMATSAIAADILDLTDPRRTSGIWPRVVPFTICEANIKDGSGNQLIGAELKAVQTKRGCFTEKQATSQFLNDTNAAQIRGAVEYWNGLFGKSVKFEERYVRDRPNIVMFKLGPLKKVGGKWYSSACGTEAPLGFAIDQPIKTVTLYENCDGGEVKPGSFLRPFTVIHEMMHVVGVYHEMARPEFLKYFSFTPTDTGPACLKKLERKKSQFITRGKPIGPYDFNSVMHYGLQLDDGGCRYEVKPSPLGIAEMDVQGVTATMIGQRSMLSKGDIAAIKALYP